ncbi:MAG: amino acid adenylation domain-containing protein [Bacteroidota bacterium]
MQQFLAQHLPSYMLPARYIEVRQWPVTSQGKIATTPLLQLADQTKPAIEQLAPRNAVEEQIHQIWCELLDRQSIGIHEHFFEIGGDSLVAIRLNAAIQAAFDRQLEVRDVLYYPTIAGLAQHLQGAPPTTVLPPIVSVERPNRTPLSFAQERLWFIDQLGGSTQYHMPTVLRFGQAVNRLALEKAFHLLLERHEVLRTILVNEAGKVYQKVQPATAWHLNFRLGKQWDAAEQAIFIQQIIQQPFDLSTDYLLRVHLIQQAATDHLLVIVMHHIASDGWSVGILLNELLIAYQAILLEQPLGWKPLPLQYADYAIWQRKNIDGDYLAQQLNWWEQRLEGLQPLDLPLDHPRPVVQSYRGSRHSFQLDQTTTQQIKHLLKEQDCTLFMFLLAAFKVLLYRYSGQGDLCIGTPVVNRHQPELEPMIGFFLNTLAVRSVLRGEQSFLDVLQQVKENTLSAFERQAVPFEKIVDRVESRRDQSRSPIFQAMLVLQNTPSIEEQAPEEWHLENVAVEAESTLFDLTLNAAEWSDQLSFNLAYCTDLFEQTSIESMSQHFIQLLHAIVMTPQQAIARLQWLGQQEQTLLLEQFNPQINPQINTNDPKQTILSLFEQQVQAAGENIAVESEQVQWTYQGLNQLANQLAYWLQAQHGVKAEQLVGIQLKREVWTLVAILGALKAGAAYVPIDPNYPAQRKEWIRTNSACQLVLNDALMQQFRNERDANWPTLPTDAILPKHLAYVLYTSGSTGRPKGVMIEHASLVQYIKTSQKRYGITGANFHFPWLTSLSFDLTQTSLMLPLLSGGSIYVPKGDDFATMLTNSLQHPKVNALKLTPSHTFFLELLPSSSNLKLAILGGEPLTTTAVQQVRRLNSDICVFNEYGPTEATVGCVVEEVSDAQKLLIGRPMDHVQVYILDQFQQLLPIGAKGELYISGPALARGYLGRRELTAKKFIDHPFVVGEKLYRTGDLARWHADGRIEFLGRMDEQVKIRGHRVELAEVCAVLMASPMVEQATVLVKKATHTPDYLIAYVVAGEHYTGKQLQHFLQQNLPEYMVPKRIIQLEAMPLTSNGKINRKALSEYDDPESSSKSVEGRAPQNEIERDLVNIWQSLLPVAQVSVFDNFFELGGDSILSIQVISRAQRKGYQLQPRDLFQHQTIETLAAYIETKINRPIQSEQGVLTGNALLLPIQHWFFNHPNPYQTHYNQGVLLEISKEQKRNSIESVLDALVERHDALRFSYQQIDGHWQQQYGTKKRALSIFDLQTEASQDWNQQLEKICVQCQGNLAFDNGQLYHFALILTPNTEVNNRLLLVVHHLAIDTVSWRILIDELKVGLQQNMEGLALDWGKKGTSFRQWATALNQRAHHPQVLAQLPFWEQVAKTFEPLPCDHAVALSRFRTLQDVKCQLDRTTTQALLQKVHQAYGTTMDDLLLAALGRTLADWLGKEQVCLGLEGHGRADFFEDIQLTNLVGWLTNLYPLNLLVEKDQSMAHLIKSIKEQRRTLPEEGMGFGLLKYLHPDPAVRARLDKATWEIVFNNLGQIDFASWKDQWLGIAKETEGPSIHPDYPVREKLLINCFVAEGQLNISWTYSDQQYFPSTIQQLANRCLEVLHDLIDHCLGQAHRAATPSDHGLDGVLSIQEFDDLQEVVQQQALDGDEILKF